MTPPDGDVQFEVRGAVGLVTLNRPKSLNALNQAMCAAIGDRLAAWATDPAVAAVAIRGAGDRAFCAGGDVRAVYEDGMAFRRGRSDGRMMRELFRDEYRMNRRIKIFPKPYIALIDRITMGGGIGLSIHGSHRVATERTLLAMPETGIGLFPDVGTSYALPRLPGEVGTYLALTGARIKTADALAIGVATHSVAGDRLDDLVDDLIRADWSRAPHPTADAVLRGYATDPGQAELLSHRATIDRCFVHDRVEPILAALDGEDSEFAAATAATIRTRSPTSLKITLEEMRRGRTLDFDSCLTMEYRLTQSFLAGHDFYEGIRAALVDKDHRPKWEPSTVEAVDDDIVDRYFVAPPQGDLTFPD